MTEQIKRMKHLKVKHEEKNVEDGLSKHLADSIRMIQLLRNYLIQNIYHVHKSVRFGLASNGFQLYYNMDSQYSFWSATFVPYNLPSWMCMKYFYFMMVLLIRRK